MTTMIKSTQPKLTTPIIAQGNPFAPLPLKEEQKPTEEPIRHPSIAQAQPQDAHRTTVTATATEVNSQGRQSEIKTPTGLDQVSTPKPDMQGSSQPASAAQAIKTESKTPGGVEKSTAPKPESQGSERPVSMMVPTQQKLAQSLSQSRETVDIKNLDAPILEEEDQGSEGVNKDTLTEQDDPHNYLEVLSNPQSQIKIEDGAQMKEDIPSVVLDDDGYHSDESFGDEFYMTMHEEMIEKITLDKNSEEYQTKKRLRREKNGLKLEEHGFRNQIRIIDWNERRHQYVARQKLQQHGDLSAAIREQDLSEKKGEMQNMRILTSLQILNSITNKIVKERQYSQAKATSIALNDELVFIGTSEGQVWMFGRENEDEYDSFTDKSKEFLGNAVTAIDVHPLRPEYAVLGYERGQLVLFDATEPKKSIKTIKDSHPGSCIKDIRFCAWAGGKSADKQDEFNATGEDDPKAWMFVSIDNLGRVVLNTVQKKLFGMSASKHVIVDPQKNHGPFSASPFHAVASRFHSSVHDQGIYDDMTLFAIGSPDRVLIIEGKASNHIQQAQFLAPEPLGRNNSVSLSWGHGMTPQLMDRPHTLLAIGWGPLIQIVILIDHEDREHPFLLDGFYILRNVQTESVPVPMADGSLVHPLELAVKDPDAQIEWMNFISDSTLLIVTQTTELKVVHTQQLCPNSIFYQRDKPVDPEEVESIIVAKAELVSGIRGIPLLLRSDYTHSFGQTVKFFFGKLVVLTQKNIQASNHLTWQDSIHEFKRQVHDDLIQVFSRAISIYKGRVKGYKGLLDNGQLRESLLKGELKLLVKDIILQLIDKTKQESDRIISQTLNEAKPLMDAQDDSKEEIKVYLQKLEQFEDEKKKKFETLIRIAIEFCVELRDCDFLFKDLFWLFQEEKIESLFVQELEPFIMAGKLQDWELPNEVIQNHVIKYYKDPSKAEALEKIIVNLNLKRSPKTIVLEFIHFAEQHYLTTAILFLHTQVFEKKDNTSCTTVLCSLFDLYKKANKKNLQAMLMLKPQQAGSPQVVDITNLREAPYESLDKQQIERSQTYLGYKILWILNMFLDGRKFPAGSIRESMWRAYLHDIIEFLSNQEYLKTLLSIDAESVFQMIAVLFKPSGGLGPFELIQMGREEEAIAGNEEFKKDDSHHRFIKVLDKYCLRPETAENIRFQYLYFVTKVISKSPAVEKYDPTYFQYVLKEILTNHKRYAEFLKKIYDMSAQQRCLRVGQDPLLLLATPKEWRKRDIDRCTRKVQEDIIRLIKKSQPLNNLQTAEIARLSELTSFNRVKTEIYEQREEYVKSLQMLLASYQQLQGSSTQTDGEEVIDWIAQKLEMLEKKATKSGEPYDKKTFDEFKKEVIQNFKSLVIISVKNSIRLVEEKMGSNHKDVLEALARDPPEQLEYLDALLASPDNSVLSTIRRHIQGEAVNPADAKRCLDFLKLHVRLACQVRPTEVQTLIRLKVLAKNSCYPLEECLHICQEYKQVESVFQLSKKLGKYFESVKQGVTILKERVDYQKLLVEMYYCHEHDISLKFNLPKSKRVEIQEAAEREEKLKKQAEEEAKRKAKSVVPILARNGMVFEQSVAPIEAPKVIIERPVPPTIAYFDQIFGRILKICMTYTKEIEQKQEDQMWFMVVDGIMDTLRPLQKKKSFALRFYEDRFYAYVEALVKAHRDGFVRLFDHLLKPQTSKAHFRFNDLQTVIQKMFMDQRLEKLVLDNANNSISKVNNDIFEQFSMLTKSGILCRQRVCGVCKRCVDTGDITIDDDFTFEVEDDGQAKIHVFACMHQFHIKCLKQKYLRQFGNTNASKDEIEKMFINTPEKLRCVTCNLKSIDLDNEKRKGPAASQTPKAPQGKELKDKEKPEEEQEEGIMKAARQRTSVYRQKLYKLNKVMDTFEKQQGSSGASLTIRDFKRM